MGAISIGHLPMRGGGASTVFDAADFPDGKISPETNSFQTAHT
jgi:hypothetical protein